MRKHLFNPAVQSVRLSPLLQMNAAIQAVPEAVSLAIGEPDFPTPLAAKEAGKRAIEQNVTRYAPTPGTLDLRAAAAAFLETFYGVSYHPNSEVLVTNGTTEALFLSLKTLIAPGDEVIVPTPAYPGYEPAIQLCGGRLVPVDVSATGFKLTPSQLQAALTPKTKAVLLPYPSNPTGAVLSRSELDALAHVLENHSAFVISDELYSELVFDGKHVSVASVPALRRKAIVINGVSKSHAMTGWRIGFTFAPADITEELCKVHEFVTTSISSVSQAAAAFALRQEAGAVRRMRDAYRERRDAVCARLQAMGFALSPPPATFYAFPNCSAFHWDSHLFAFELLEVAKVGLLPSTVFTGGGHGHLRLSFAASSAHLEEALVRIEQHLDRRQTFRP